MSSRESRYFNSHHKVRHDYSRNKLQNPFYKQRDSNNDKLFKNLKLISLGLIILFGFLIWFFLFSKVFTIKNINIDGLVRTSDSEIRNLIDLQVGSSRGWVFSQNNLFIFNKGKLKNDLKEKYRFAEVSVRKKLIGTINISIKERDYAFIWGEKGKYYYIDKDAYLIKEIPSSFTLISNLVSQTTSSSSPASATTTNTLTGDNFSSSTASTTENIISNDSAILLEALREVKKTNKNNYPIIDNLTDTKINNEKINLDIIYFNFISKLFSSFKDSQDPGLIISRFTIDSDFNTIKVDLDDGPIIYFSTKEDSDNQIRSLFILRKELKDNFNKLIKKKIDLRYGDKVYYE